MSGNCLDNTVGRIDPQGMTSTLALQIAAVSAQVTK
jgi:hypothetical protein